jgi:hypothetical protein
MKEYTLVARLEDQFYQSEATLCQKIELEAMSERMVSDMKLSASMPDGISLVSFDDTVKMLKKRQYNREKLIREFTIIGERMADYLEDKLGWHGEERQEAIKSSES